VATLAEQEPQLDTARRTLRLPGVAALALATTLAIAQQPAVPASSLLTRLGAPDVTTAEARAISAQLVDRPVAARTALFDALTRAYADQRQACARGRGRLLQHFAKAVPATQQRLLGRDGIAKVAALQKSARAITARPDLTKEAIATELDPLLAELRALQLPTPAQVFEQHPDLAGEAAALRAQYAQLDQWCDLCLEAAHHLDPDPDGRRHVARTGLPPAPESAAGLDAELARTCLSSLPLAAADLRALEANEALRARLDPAEFAGTLELNRIRIALGLGAVRIDERLGEAARDHSRDMHTLGFFSHESPVEGKRTFGDRAARAGTSASSENIAAGQTRGEGAIEAWWYSPGHHKNMLGSHGRTGLGRCEQTWTQLFGG
jgi:hypothetical protein